MALKIIAVVLCVVFAPLLLSVFLGFSASALVAGVWASQFWPWAIGFVVFALGWGVVATSVQERNRRKHFERLEADKRQANLKLAETQRLNREASRTAIEAKRAAPYQHYVSKTPRTPSQSID